jgi:hypothetical protein
MRLVYILILTSLVSFSCTKEIIQHKLSVEVSPLNGGQVTPPSNSYEKGQSLQMLATPAGEYIFKEWKGDLTGTSNPTTLVIDKDKQVTGSFEKRQYPLNLTIEGSGTVKEEIIAVATQSQYPSGTTVRLTPQPSEGWKFSGWSGETISISNILEITISKPISVNLKFEKLQYNLNLSTEGDGTIKEEVVPIKTQSNYPFDTSIMLTAVPRNKSIFAGWSGDIVSNLNPLTLNINKNISIKGVFSNQIPSGLRSTQLEYAIKLNWDTLKIPTIGGYLLYKGKNNVYNNLPIKVDNLGSYLDKEVSVDVIYNYKLSAIDNNNFETDKSVAISSTPIEPVNNDLPKNNEIGGIHYAYINLYKPTVTKISHQFTIYDEPRNIDGSLNSDGLYYQFYQGLMNDNIGFYYGIQTSVFNPDGTPPKKGLIFSRWGTRDISNYKLANGGFGQSAGYEGDFIGVRIYYDWKPGTYEIELKLESSDTIGDWYGLHIRSMNVNEFTYVGSIRFEKGINSKGIKSGGITWTELYYKGKINTPMPRWHVSVDKILADNQEPRSIYIDYNKDRFVGFYNIYSTDKSNFHFLMGPKVKKINNSGIIWSK